MAINALQMLFFLELYIMTVCHIIIIEDVLVIRQLRSFLNSIIIVFAKGDYSLHEW